MQIQMQCRGGGGQPIRPQGFSPASPAPPPPSFPSPNRPSPKAECGAVLQEFSACLPREPSGTRLPSGPRTNFRGEALRGRGRGVGRVREAEPRTAPGRIRRLRHGGIHASGENCLGLIWLPLAPPALHLHFVFKPAPLGRRIRKVSDRQSCSREGEGDFLKGR